MVIRVGIDKEMVQDRKELCAVVIIHIGGCAWRVRHR